MHVCGDAAAYFDPKGPAQLASIIADLVSNDAERARLVDDPAETLDSPLGLAARNEIAQPPDDLAGPHRLPRVIRGLGRGPRL